METVFSPLYYQYTCPIVPINGRTVIRKARADEKVGSLYIPEDIQKARQEDWEAEVVAIAPTGGWRMGAIQEKYLDEYGHLESRPPESLSKGFLNDAKIWKIKPYYVEAPTLPPGTKIVACNLSGQPVRNGDDGFDYYLTDGEHAYKAVRNPQPEA